MIGVAVCVGMGIVVAGVVFEAAAGAAPGRGTGRLASGRKLGLKLAVLPRHQDRPQGGSAESLEEPPEAITCSARAAAALRCSRLTADSCRSPCDFRGPGLGEVSSACCTGGCVVSCCKEERAGAANGKSIAGAPT